MLLCRAGCRVFKSLLHYLLQKRCFYTHNHAHSLIRSFASLSLWIDISFFFCLSTWMSVYLFVCLLVSISVYLSMYLSSYLSVLCRFLFLRWTMLLFDLRSILSLSLYLSISRSYHPSWRADVEEDKLTERQERGPARPNGEKGRRYVSYERREGWWEKR